MKVMNNTIVKAQSIAILFMVALLAAACGKPSADDLAAKKVQLAEAKTQLAEVKATITQLESEIAAEDPEFFKGRNTAEPVTAVKAEKTRFEHKIEVRGAVMSRANVEVSAELPGRLTHIKVKEGQRVKKGQVLAMIDAEDIERSMAITETQLRFATTVFEKRERLWKKNIGTEIRYLEAKNNKETLEKQWESLQTQLSKTSILAPFSGTIEQVPAKNGQYVQPGLPIALLVSNAENYISAEVSDAYIGRFETGDEVTVRVPSLGDTFSSTITSIGRVINKTNRTFTVEIALPKGNNYKTNLITLVHLTDFSADNSVVIPTRIIQEDLKGNYVYLIEGDKARKVYMEPGQSYDNRTRIAAGLNGGETLIDKGNRTIADGVTVSIRN